MLDFWHIINGGINVVLAVLCFYSYFIWEKKSETKSVSKLFALFGFVSLVYGLLRIIWGAGLIDTNMLEIDAIHTGFGIARAILLIFILYWIIGEKSMVYVLHFYWIMIIVGLYKSIEPLDATDFISYVMICFISLYILITSDYFLSKAGIAGVLYAGTSMAHMYLRNLQFETASKVVLLISEIMLGLVLYLFYRDVTDLGIMEKKGHSKRTYETKKQLAIEINYAKKIIIILFVLVFTVISTVSIHEIGHAVIAGFYGCENTKVVLYENLLPPHTETRCKGDFNDVIITLGGLAITTIGSFAFMMMAMPLTNNIAYIILGFGLLIGYGDMSSILLSPSIIMLVLLSGAVITLLGIIKLAKYEITREGNDSKDNKEENK